MPDIPFVINDRRKFTADGDLRPDAERPEAKLPAAPATDSTTAVAEAPQADAATESGKPHREPIAFPTSSPKSPAPAPDRSAEDAQDDETPEPRTGAHAHETIAFPSGSREEPVQPEEAEGQLPPLNAEQIEQAARAYRATVERLDTALRANNLGAEPIPEMTFERLVQSLYMQALLQLGAAAEPGQSPQVDILGARQTIDMLALIAAKSKGGLSASEDSFIESALFEIRMGFLEVTQALARQAAARQPMGAAPGSGLGSGLGPAPGAPKGPGIVR